MLCLFLHGSAFQPVNKDGARVRIWFDKTLI